MNTDMIIHTHHRKIISGWNAPRESLHTVDDLLNQQTKYYSLKSPILNYHTVSITFTTLRDHPEKMRVSCSNGSAEDEHNAIFSRNDCRAFYKRLIKAGFVAF